MYNLPFPRSPFFTGREAELEQLGQRLQESGTQPVSICGLGGVGKTQLALEYVYSRQPEVYTDVLWANAADETTLQSDCDNLADLLALPERDPNRRIQAVKAWLQTHTGWLLILDNVENLELIRSFLLVKQNGHYSTHYALTDSWHCR